MGAFELVGAALRHRGARGGVHHARPHSRDDVITEKFANARYVEFPLKHIML
jgi:hypothetical protein